MRTSRKANKYVLIHLPSHHRASNRGYVYEHIVIAEKKIGRPIFRGEQVHHIDRNRSNNHPDNLEVMSASEHVKLHAVEDKKRREKNRAKTLKMRKEKSTGLPLGYYYIRKNEKQRKVKKTSENK